ncbi:HD-like signal output (HDOD) protein/CheY-like chemotaxis protein [Catenuloplanes nepalensis]|uniref:HD-like signal output (HDOD) protein/CheY-like chemotaxis protein n=1 Tax=Catenuloplanes nepalensis TaxID=587533 RepID=A0ABT9MTV0_9ACTN|nr:response regulator [Catenuloplanes nepalensis]MDP9794885.1 HD-like signal output (HDOD) protein/CheY-like chemotaxis protein [Catenuloplanes nepalensis]
MTYRPHILFVDDEPMVIEGLGRMLRPCRKRWDMSFAGGGEAALDVLRARSCDVVVTDYRMPGMDGAALLERVRTDHPGTARVILSGQTNEDNLLRIMVLAHEMLTKPATPEELIATIDRLLAARLAAYGERERVVAFVESLPSPPRTLVGLIAALESEDTSADVVGAMIEEDPAVTAQVLHLVNSSAYTAGRRISDVGQAVALLGLHTVRGLVLMHDLVRVFDAGDALPASWIDGLTRHAIETSRLARRLGAGTEWQSQAFSAGLLHEVGQLVLASARPADFRTALDSWTAADTALEDSERRVLEVSHVQVGTSLLGLWGLPATVIAAVAGHTTPPPAGPVTCPAEAVALAHLIVETDLEPVCGSAAALDETTLDDAAREAISRWRRDRAG